MKFDINPKNENLFGGTSTAGNGFGTGAGLGAGTTGAGLGASTGRNFAGKGFSAGTAGAGAGKGLGAKFSLSQKGLSTNNNSFKKELAKVKEAKTQEPIHIEKLESAKIEREDAVFFLSLIEKGGISEVPQNQKTAAVSKTLMNLLEKANNTKAPVRLDFDNNITLVLRVDQDGKLNAQFFPGDKIAEEYLKNNIPFLRQQFEEKEIKYSNLNYHGQREKQQKEKQDE